MKKQYAIGATLAVAGIAAAAVWSANLAGTGNGATTTLAGGPIADVILPETLSANAQLGKRGFEAKCAACHGINAAGREGIAPPLVHIIYEPSHHGDESFQRAAATGVRAHHWKFGNMPPVTGVTRSDVAMITTYIREMQQANGIK